MALTDAVFNIPIVSDSRIKTKPSARTQETDFLKHLSEKSEKFADKKKKSDFGALGTSSALRADKTDCAKDGETVKAESLKNEPKKAENTQSAKNESDETENPVEGDAANAELMGFVAQQTAGDGIKADSAQLFDLISQIEGEISALSENADTAGKIKEAFAAADEQAKVQSLLNAIEEMNLGGAETKELLSKIASYSGDVSAGITEPVKAENDTPVPEQHITADMQLPADEITAETADTAAVNNTAGLNHSIAKTAFEFKSANKAESAENNSTGDDVPVQENSSEISEVTEVTASNTAEESQETQNGGSGADSSDGGEDTLTAKGNAQPLIHKTFASNTLNETRFEYTVKNNADISGEIRTAIAERVYSQLTVNNSGTEEFVIKLNPENLGMLTIKMEKLADGLKIKILTTDNKVNSLIADQISVIKESIEQKGIKMSNIDVAFEQPDMGSFNPNSQHSFNNNFGGTLSKAHKPNNYTEQYDKQAVTDEQDDTQSVRTISLYDSSVEFLA